MSVTMDGLYVDGEKVVFHPEDILTGDPTAYTEEIGTAVNAWMEENVTGGEQVTDTTLSLSGVPADAKKTGDEISSLKEDLNEIADNTFTETLTVSSGNVAQNFNYDWIVGHTYRIYYFRSDASGGGYFKAYTMANGEIVETISSELLTYTYAEFTPTLEANQVRIIAYSSGTVIIYDTCGVGRKVAKLENVIQSVWKTEDITSKLVFGYIPTNTGFGATVDTSSPTVSESFMYCVVECKQGDTFTISGKGGSTPRLWAFLDNDKKIQKTSGPDATESDLELEAQKDGYFVYNTLVTSTTPYNLKHTHYMDIATAKEVEDLTDQVINITDPYQLRWCYGYWSSGGNGNYSTTGFRTVDTLSIKAGSSIRVASGAQIQTRFTPINGTASYVSYSTRGVTFTEDGLLEFGIRYSDQRAITDISILDYLTLNLFIDGNLPNIFKRAVNLFGLIPNNIYVGKHTDATGLGQNTVYADAISLWRGLPSLSNGYITETDLGVPYTGAEHMYCYKLNPPIHSNGRVVLPHIFIVTSVHGHEKSATYGLYYLIKDMLDHAMDDPVLFYLRNNVRFTILPMANPYGWDYNDSDLGTHGGTRYNENGININRNYGSTAWSVFDDDPTYTTPWQYNARGTAPFSEAETQKIREQIISAGDVSLFIDLHTNGIDTQNRNDITYASMLNIENDYIQSFRKAITSYLLRNKTQMDYEYDVNLGNVTYGTAEYNTLNLKAEDWGGETLRIPSFTFEVPPGSTTDFLGDNLGKYTPDLIKLCGEMIGNFLINILQYMNN